MTILCETVETLVTATSTTLLTTTTVVMSAVSATTTIIGGVAALLVSSAVAVSTHDVEQYATSTNSAAAISTPFYASSIYPEIAVEDARAKAIPFVAFGASVVSSAGATGVGSYTVSPVLAVSRGTALGTATYNVVFASTVRSSANAVSTTVRGGYELAASVVTSASTLYGTRVAQVVVTGTAAGQDTVYALSVPQAYVAVSAGVATSATYVQMALAAQLDSAAIANDSVWYKDPNRVAWVMNTETTAASWYTNYDFDSIAQVPGKELAVGPDGLYVLAGVTDAGDFIKASVSSGFDDFGTPQTKRLDALYFGYTSAGRLSVSVETYGSGHPASVYSLEERAAAAPRNSRVIPGKGLVGRYWRTTIENINGVDFDVYDTSVDIAISARRV